MKIDNLSSSFNLNVKSPVAPVFKVGDVFYSKWLRNVTTKQVIPITVIRIEVDSDTLVVDWGSGCGYDHWHLSACENAIKIGEYSFTPFK